MNSLLIILLFFTGFLSSMPRDGRIDEAISSCSEFADEGYHCVPYYQCDDCNTIIVDGASLFDPRSSCEKSESHKRATTSKCSKPIEVCCRHPSRPPPGEVIETEPTCPLTNCSIDDDIFAISDETCFPECPLDPPGKQCGMRNINGVGQSQPQNPEVGEANFGEWPHVCAVLKKEVVDELNNEEVHVYLCGASLLAEQVVLTAGHCVNGTETEKLVIRCGEWDTQNEDETLPHQERQVSKIVRHPDLDVENHHNNFALLFVGEKFEIMDHISPICLPQPNRPPTDSEFCVSHGWGKDKFGSSGRYQEILKEVVIPVISNERCQKDLRENTRLGPFFELDSSFMCAGGVEGIDTCKGDGGSPLVCKRRNGPWYQAGIVSWGIGCGDKDIPAVYASVATVSCWIDEEVSSFYQDDGSFFGLNKKDCP